ncbi:potassium voltage-gated channel subfamily E regulatory beta subunit 5 [Alligator mississippiensis]|uniref:potassium voltage-gated channel subfamily E regulatory beta subunit 5 n=1 Tax=Alligator mississippiensis TaxID=8496 RepID=UPI0028775978|nr:potassium voltage-gated channel subfamily E regulatory beta subunit 5 [Alligator mississippiensis]
MNCSEWRRLRALLEKLLRELPGAGNATGPGPGPGAGAGADASLYILLIMIFYGSLAGALILAYTRSRKLESKHDPFHVYIERDWGPRARPDGPDDAPGPEPGPGPGPGPGRPLP